MSSANPEIITNTINFVKEVSENVPVLCGAGVNSAEDTRKSVELGAKGVLVASAVMESEYPEESIRELIRGLAQNKNI